MKVVGLLLSLFDVTVYDVEMTFFVSFTDTLVRKNGYYCEKITSQISIQETSSNRTNRISFLLGTSEGNVVGVILGKWMKCTVMATDGIPLGWSLGPLIGMWEGFLLGIPARARYVLHLVVEQENALVLRLAWSFATQWELLYLSTNLLFCYFFNLEIQLFWIYKGLLSLCLIIIYVIPGLGCLLLKLPKCLKLYLEM